MQTRATRNWRPLFFKLAFHSNGRAQTESVPRRAVLSRLSRDQLSRKSTRGSTPGLIDPALGETGGRIAYPTTAPGFGEARSCPVHRATGNDIREAPSEDDTNGSNQGIFGSAVGESGGSHQSTEGDTANHAVLRDFAADVEVDGSEYRHGVDATGEEVSTAAMACSTKISTN